jgi:predicted transposase/invertase (TIGR01784 family)
MYDNICKYIAETFSNDLAQWLLGQPIELTLLQPTELQVAPIRADSLIFLQSADLILHIEFQTDPKEDILFRMADYRLRIYRRFPDKQVHQVVIYLRETDSALARVNNFILPELRHEFNVLRLWEIPTEQLLQSLGLLPFAVLSQTENPVQVLEQVARRIDRVADRQERSALSATTAILAGLVLDKMIITRLLREDLMKESVIYQEIEAASEAKGLERGIQAGIQTGEANLVLRLLHRRIGEIPRVFSAKIRELSVEQLENLGEALLEFNAESDLRDWFAGQE